MTKRAHSTVVYPTVKQYEALEADNADLLACLRELVNATGEATYIYMNGDYVDNGYEAMSKARALIERLAK